MTAVFDVSGSAADADAAGLRSTANDPIYEALHAELDLQRAQLAEQQADLLLIQADAGGTESQEIVETTISRLRAVVHEIESALDRIDAGTFGICERCGGSIPLERLEAIPEARTCVACTGRRRGFL